MGDEAQSRARQREIHGLRMDLKREILGAQPGTESHRELTRKLEALNQDNDVAHEQWFKDLTTKFPL